MSNNQPLEAGLQEAFNESECWEEQQKCQIYRPRSKRIDQNIIEGLWTQEESAKFIAFMEFKKDIFLSKTKRKYFKYLFRQLRIFRQLSNFLKTRNPAQCRSHFQKLSRHKKKVNTIIVNEKQNFPKSVYEKAFKEVLEVFCKKENQQIKLESMPKQTENKPTSCSGENNEQIQQLQSNVENVPQQLRIDPFTISLYWSFLLQNQNHMLGNCFSPNLPFY